MAAADIPYTDAAAAFFCAVNALTAASPSFTPSLKVAKDLYICILAFAKCEKAFV